MHPVKRHKLLWTTCLVLIHQHFSFAAESSRSGPDPTHGVQNQVNGTDSHRLNDWHLYGWRVPLFTGDVEINPLFNYPTYLRSRLFNDSSCTPTYLRFQYFISHPQVSNLSVTVHESQGADRQTWAASPYITSAGVWLSAVVNITSAGPFWVKITGQKRGWNYSVKLRQIQFVWPSCDASSTTSSTAWMASSMSTVTPTGKQGSDPDPSGELVWSASGWLQYPNSSVKDIQSLRTRRPATLTSQMLSSTGNEVRCMHFRYLLKCLQCWLTVTLREQGGTEVMLWDSRNETVQDGVWQAVSLNHSTNDPYQMEITGLKFFWNDEVVVSDLHVLSSPCPLQQLTTTPAPSALPPMKSTPSPTTQRPTSSPGSDPNPSGQLVWGASGWLQYTNSSVREIQSLRTRRPATLTSQMLSSTRDEVRCMHLRYLLKCLRCWLTVTLHEQRGTEVMLWDSRNETVRDDVWRAVFLNHSTKGPYQMKIAGQKSFWNDEVFVSVLHILPSPCAPQQQTTTPAPSAVQPLMSTTPPATQKPTSAPSTAATTSGGAMSSSPHTSSKAAPTVSSNTTALLFLSSLSSSTARLRTEASTATTRSSPVSPTKTAPEGSTATTTRAPFPTTSFTSSSSSSSSSTSQEASASAARNLHATEERSSGPSPGTVAAIFITVIVLIGALCLVGVFVYRRGYYAVCFKYLRFRDDQEGLEVSFHSNTYDSPDEAEQGSTNQVTVGIQRNFHTSDSPQRSQTGFTNNYLGPDSSADRSQAMRDDCVEIGEDPYQVIDPRLLPGFASGADDNRFRNRSGDLGFIVTQGNAASSFDGRSVASAFSNLGYGGYGGQRGIDKDTSEA